MYTTAKSMFRNCLLEVPKKGSRFFGGCVVNRVVYGKCGGLNWSCLWQVGGDDRSNLTVCWWYEKRTPVLGGGDLCSMQRMWWQVMG